MADDMKLMRLVRPIYEAIDNRQYKNAIKLCNQKKVCDIDLVQVLQAHCLERIGKVDDALRIVRRVQLNKPTDDTILSTMQLVFKLCGAAAEIVPSYEHAAAVQPQNEELQTSLFFNYARTLSLAKQQQLAFKMYKTFGKLRYVGWACLSMLLQVTVEKSLPMKMLPLADKMLAKALRDHPAEANGEAVSLLVLLLQAQNKPAEALEAFTEFIHVTDAPAPAPATKPRALEGDGVPDDEIDLGPMQAIDRLVLEATLAKDVGDDARCAAVYKTLLTSYNADDWAFWLGLIAASPTADVLPVIRALQEQHGLRLRGPHLAEVEVHFQLLAGAVDAAVTADLVPRLLVYMENFATKSCCFSDVKRYLELPPSARAAVVAAMEARLSAATAEFAATAPAPAAIPAATAAFRKGLLARKVLRFLGTDAGKSATELEARADALLAEYEAAQWLNEATVGGQREVQVTDDLVLLAGHLLLDAHSAAPAAALLSKAAAALESGLARSAYNFQMKLLLCRVYALLGAGAAVLTRYKELDVKQIQLDSLSHLVLDGLFALGLDEEALRICDAVRALHQTTARDTPEFIGRAYRLGVFSKAEDMTSFLVGKMQRSEMLALATAEAAHAQMLRTCSSAAALHAHVEAPALAAELDALLAHAALSANHHRDVEVRWTPATSVEAAYLFAPNGVSSCDRTRDSAQLRAWLELRAAAPKALRAALEAVPETVTHVERFQAAVTKIAVAPLAAEWSMVSTAAAAMAAVARGDLAAAKVSLEELAKGVPGVAALQFDGVVSAHGLSKAAIFLRDVVPYTAMFLSVMMKQLKPKKKTKDPLQKDVAELLRQIVLKTTQVLTAGEKSIRAVRVAMPAPEVVQTKVESAHKAALERLSKTISDRVAFLRSL
ncbi:hypothetical protein ACHHYP_09206 [Achlya hypogyna]|uniref:N-alpha-acetyltransferase 25, NatB auxiliary subunit n=1 Tax=Achlya hypogyna TaxID=1202772 RepID=A0A1V9ZJE1_ACHHY|nr:hypothetical protein ACHHYP_09206 [Achlya hypogyna]